MRRQQAHNTIAQLERRFGPILERKGSRIVEFCTSACIDGDRSVAGRIYVPTEPSDSLEGTLEPAMSRHFESYIQLASGLVVHERLASIAQSHGERYNPRDGVIVVPGKDETIRYLQRWLTSDGKYCKNVA